jgi:hypothetical protein
LRLPLVNFDCEVVARKVSGSDKSWYGVYVVQGRGEGEVRYHDFFLSGKGTYTYEVKTMDRNEKAQQALDIIQRAQLAPAIKSGDDANRIRLSRRGSTFGFWANGVKLLTAHAAFRRREKVQVGIAVHTERDLAAGNHIDVAFKDWRWRG